MVNQSDLGNDWAGQRQIRLGRTSIHPMKSFRSILTDLALLATTGCIFPGHRDTADDVAPRRNYQSKTYHAGMGRNKSPAGRGQVKTH